jgi:hypothetical protein
VTGIVATWLGLLADKATVASNRAWSKVDKPARHTWTGTPDQLAVMQKTLMHRLRVNGTTK